MGAAGNERRPVAGSNGVAVGAIAERESARLMLHVGVAAQFRMWHVSMRAGTFIGLVPTF